MVRYGLGAGLAAAAGVVIFALMSRPYQLDGGVGTAYWFGLGLCNDDSIFGKRVTKIEAWNPDWTVCRITYQSPGYNYFVGYYTTGVLRQEGWCYAKRQVSSKQFLVDSQQILAAKYYLPDGKLACMIENGTGTMQLFNEEAKLRFEARLLNGRQRRVTQCDEMGRVKIIVNFEKEWEMHFHSNGRVAKEGPVTEGYQRFGQWNYYDIHGTLLKTDHLGARRPPDAGEE